MRCHKNNGSGTFMLLLICNPLTDFPLPYTNIYTQLTAQNTYKYSTLIPCGIKQTTNRGIQTNIQWLQSHLQWSSSLHSAKTDKCNLLTMNREISWIPLSFNLGFKTRDPQLDAILMDTGSHIESSWIIQPRSTPDDDTSNSNVISSNCR